MAPWLQLILDWSEVWAAGLALLALVFHRRQPKVLRPVILYLFLALVINLAADVIADFKRYLPLWLQSNNPLYNLHSVVRFACFSAFFLSLRQPSFARVKRWLPVLSLVFIVINFTVFEDFLYPDHLSGNLLSVEAYLLLIYCMLYYLAQLKEDVEEMTKRFDFWVVTGLSVYVVVNFFVFLFYVPMNDFNTSLANQMWDVHNVAYILLCFFIAKAFYVSPAN